MTVTTKDEIIEMAKEAGFFINQELTITSPFIEDICISPMLKEFAKLVAAKEREACAKVCEVGLPIATSLNALDEMEMWGEKFAAAIRARGEA